MLKLPNFETEAEEAEWWFTHQEEIADELERVKPKIGPSRLMRMRAAALAGKSEEDATVTRPESKLSRSA